MSGRVKVSPFRSPVVGQVLARRSNGRSLAVCSGFAVLHFVLVVSLAYDLAYGSWLSSLLVTYVPVTLRPLVVFFQCVVCFLCTLSFAQHVFRAASTPMTSVKMTSGQSKLLKETAGEGVLVSDIFQDGLPQRTPPRPQLGTTVSPMGGVGGGYVPMRNTGRNGFDSSTSAGVRARHTHHSNMSSPSYRMSLSGDGTIADLHSLSGYLQQSPVGSPGSSYDSLNRSSFSGSSMFGSALGFSSVSMSSASLAHPDLTTRDFSPVSARYQVASRSPSPHSGGSSSSQDGAQKSYLVKEVWMSLGVDRPRLDMWTERCRRWLTREIFQPLVKEIDSLNKALRDGGCSHLQLGVSESHALQKAGLNSVIHQLPNLSLILQYLDLSPNQEYLVWRIRELARGTCLSSFRWDSGGRADRGDWDASLPTDVAIVFHLFCTYMDSCLPPSPRIPDRRTFTLQYVNPIGAGKSDWAGGRKSSPQTSPLSSRRQASHGLKSSSSHSLGSKAESEMVRTSPHSSHSLAHLSPDISFVHVSERPPHYCLSVAGKQVDVGAGRNNLFHSILYFLNHVKSAKHGMLGTVNLPLAGVNILTIVNDS